MNDCIFCKIVKGEIPCSKVLETDKILAFNDIQPVAPVHVLIVPKEHIATFNDVGESRKDILEEMALAAGIPTESVIVDAGLDLGKTEAQSLELLRGSDRLVALGHPTLLSASNKRFNRLPLLAPSFAGC